MNPNELPPENNNPLPPTPQPEEPTYNPFAADAQQPTETPYSPPATEGQQPIETPYVQPVTETPQPSENPYGQPAAVPQQPTVSQNTKKPGKGRLIAIIAAAILLVAGIVTAILAFNFSSQATEAAEQYNSSLRTHIEGVLDADTDEDRLAKLKDRVSLKEVSFGSLLSEDYSKAQDLEKNYAILVKESSSDIKKYASFSDMSSLIRDFSAVSRDSSYAKTPELSINDKTSGDKARQHSKVVQDKADRLSALSKRMNDYLFDEEYRSDQADVAKYLQEMSDPISELAEVFVEQGDIYDKATAGEATEEMAAEVKLFVAQLEMRLPSLVSNYTSSGQKFIASLDSLSKNVIGNEYQKKVADAHKEALDKLKSFKDSIA